MKRHLMLTGKGTLMHKWRIGPVDLGLAKTDLFDLDVNAVDNSEQSDFRLSVDPETISEQLFKRFGGDSQHERDQQTNLTFATQA